MEEACGVENLVYIRVCETVSKKVGNAIQVYGFDPTCVAGLGKLYSFNDAAGEYKIRWTVRKTVMPDTYPD
jgi:hypothetical protein